MCTQEIVWCSCGHGELLPIVPCSHAELLGKCWTVVHGDHRIVVQMQCSYCLLGMSAIKRLCSKARPEGDLAEKVERIKEEGQQQQQQNLGEVFGGEDGVTNTAGEVPLELQDVVHTDWENFTLDPELWQYV